MGGEYGPLRRRHSRKCRAVPVRCPSIVRHLVALRRILLMPSSGERAHRGVLVTVLCIVVTFAHAQQFPTIDSLNESYVSCVRSAFVRRLDDSSVQGNVPHAFERAFLDCKIEEDAL
jgi:hypothetical protein